MKLPRFVFTLIVILVMVGSSVSLALAASLSVTKSADTDDGVCNSDCSLREAIAAASPDDMITFDSNLAGQTIYLTSTLLIDKSLTIDGSSLAPHIQVSGDTDNDGMGDVSVFEIGGLSTVELNGLDIVKGKTSGVSGGGGIANYGTLTINNSTLSGNSYAGGIGGGGIYNKGELTIIDSIVASNSAKDGGDGGGIFNEYGHALTITGSTFSDNTAISTSDGLRGDGGGITNIGTLSVDDSTFLGNRAYKGGGAIVNSINGISTVTNSSFTNNSAFGFGNGGAINNYEGNMAIENCTFTGNSDFGGESNGGAVYNEDQMNITGSTFTGNSSSHSGGGIANFGKLTVTNSTLSSNSAFQLGGGIINSGNLAITNTNISENSATTGGGGVLNENDGILTVVNSTISYNSAPNGGGIFNLSSTGTVNISSSTLSGNSVSDNGGGISNWGTLTATNITLFDNSAKFGGGIFNLLGTSTVTNSTISGNSALTSGGGIFNDSILNYANTIIANSTSGGDCFNDENFGVINTNIHSLVENNAASPNQCGTPDLAVDPNLGPLADNGGSTLTMNLLPGSPAIDAGDNTNCPGTDQRGIVRPQGAYCDIGAYEYQEPSTPTPTNTVTPTPTSTETPEPTATFTYTPTDTPTYTPTFTPTDTPTPTNTPTSTPTFSPTPTSTSTSTPTSTATATATSTTTSTPTILMATLISIGANDGWVLESRETSNTGGTLNTGATTFNLGDDAANKQYRVILHFDTSSLPNTAVITSASVKIKQQGLVGTTPFTTHNGLLTDIQKPYFGSTSGLVISDFQAVAGQSAVSTFGVTPVNSWYSAVLNSSAYPYINTTGTTQFRLRFSLDDNNDHGADYMKFYSGGDSAANRPILIIQYYVP